MSETVDQKKYEQKFSIDERQKYTTDTDYSVFMDFIVKGPVKKNDIMGAIYKHNASVLSQLTLENMQIKRRLGRFEIELNTDNVNTYGQIIVPLKGTDVEISLVAGNLETISKIGPFVATFNTVKIRHDREYVKTKIFQNAKLIYDLKFETKVQSVAEFKKLLAHSNEKLNVTELEENIFAGPHHTNKELYVVEGIADIKNLAKYKIYNTISVNGANFAPEVLDKYLMGKILTVIVDADRGGQMLLKKLAQFYKITYVVEIPAGKSVEILNKSEIFNALYHNRRAL